jgi:hypothetical protein
MNPSAGNNNWSDKDNTETNSFPQKKSPEEDANRIAPHASVNMSSMSFDKTLSMSCHQLLNTFRISCSV